MSEIYDLYTNLCPMFIIYVSLGIMYYYYSIFYVLWVRIRQNIPIVMQMLMTLHVYNTKHKKEGRENGRNKQKRL